MATKAQLARKRYGVGLCDLTPQQKAQITKDYKAQFEDESVEQDSDVSGGAVTVKFARPGYNGVKEVCVNDGTNVEAALDQSGLKINKDKEGILRKDGSLVKFDDAVEDGTLYVITPGVDSSC